MVLLKSLVAPAVIFLTAHWFTACYPILAPGLASGPIPVEPYFATATPAPIPTDLPSTLEELEGPVSLALSPFLPERHAAPIRALISHTEALPGRNGGQPIELVDDPSRASTRIDWIPLLRAQHPLAERYYAVVVPFTAERDNISLEEILSRWLGHSGEPLFMTPDTAEIMPAVLGREPNAATIVEEDALLGLLETTPNALALVPFDRLEPNVKVLTVDAVNLLDNHFDPNRYPLAAGLEISGSGAASLARLLHNVVQPTTNRDPTQLTTVLMTGVTAMSRATAAMMELKGDTFPAELISDTLSAADITHVSNEVPFLDDCVVNNTVDNLVLCSHTDYWAALEAIGTDIVGLSGNHVNDFGRDGALRSLQFYRDHDISFYGSGLNSEEACAPLRWHHNGNTFAFLAVLAFGPSGAWATDELPGACYYYDHKDAVLDQVRKLADEVDIVAVELQYLETYSPAPTDTQVEEFRELRAAGADIVTGVQSHVPQAIELYGANDAGEPGVILYGLGNLFFDQMWSWETRTELMARHSIYQGRVLSTELLTAVLEEYAQPRWATPDERSEILTRIFTAAPGKP